MFPALCEQRTGLPLNVLPVAVEADAEGCWTAFEGAGAAVGGCFNNISDFRDDFSRGVPWEEL